jgi:tetratricopeptide (TPR) repeat protein
MAENPLREGLTGAEPEGGDAESTPAGVDPVASAVAMDAAKYDPLLASKVGDYLDRQAKLVAIQTQHLHEQREVILANLTLKRWGERIKIGVQIFFVIAVSAMAVGLLEMVHDAATSRSVVVEPFDAPPALTAKGLTGEVAARQLASRMDAIRRTANAVSIAQSDETRADIGQPVKLEIPETGVSLEELRRFLHVSLGHERHISGDLRSDAPGQITITLRLDGADPVVLHGAATDADALIQSAAERAFAILDPVNSVIYLEAEGRRGEALAEAENIARHNPGTVSAGEAYSLWADADLNRGRAAQAAAISISLDPRLMVGWWEAAEAAHDLGQAQTELVDRQRLLATRRTDQPLDQRDGYRRQMASTRAQIAAILGDFTQPAPASSQGVDSVPNMYAGKAELAFRGHDSALGRQLYERMRMAGGIDPVDDLQLRWLAAANSADWSAARRAAEALVAAQRAKPAATKLTSDGQPDLQLATLYQPELALSLAKTGADAQALALIGSTPTDCYLCLRVRAQVAAARGDAAGADRWFAEAVRQAPSIPFAFAEWGEVLAARGNFGAAIETFRLAHEKGAHWADPLKSWGDALAQQGDWAGAVAKYQEALKFAPAWAELLQARDAAVKRAPVR